MKLWTYKGNPGKAASKLAPKKTTFLTNATGAMYKLGK
jgi:hypothetical protein